jgi:hypothetical protein
LVAPNYLWTLNYYQEKFSVSAAYFLAVDSCSGEGSRYFLSELRPLFGVITHKSLCIRSGILPKLLSQFLVSAIISVYQFVRSELSQRIFQSEPIRFCCCFSNYDRPFAKAEKRDSRGKKTTKVALIRKVRAQGGEV